MAVGKWHLAPRWDLTASGPFDRWPLGVGFERYYGFPHGDTNQWSPNLVRDNDYVEPPRTPDEGYHLTEDLADQAIAMIGEQQQATPHTPFFLYFATGAMHAPHQAPARVDRAVPRPVRRRLGRVARARVRPPARARDRATGDDAHGAAERPRPMGRPPGRPSSASTRARWRCSPASSRTPTTRSDACIDFLDELGVLDDTIVMLCSDNGASAEGGEHGSFNEHAWAFGQEDDYDVALARIDELGGHRAYNHYSWGWAWAGNTPLRLWKRYTWLGGTRTPLIVHWPNGIAARGEVRSQFCHAIDLAPTILDAAGITAPAVVDGVDQQPMHGASLAAYRSPTPTADAPRDSQYFEMLGSRAMVRDRWKATTDHMSQGVPDEARIPGSRDFDTDRWSLFDLDADFSEAHDVAEDAPGGRRRQLEQLWWGEAGRYNVLPLDDTLTGRVVAIEPSPHPARYRWTFRPGPPHRRGGHSDARGRLHGPRRHRAHRRDGAGGCALRAGRLDQRLGVPRARRPSRVDREPIRRGLPHSTPTARSRRGRPRSAPSTCVKIRAEVPSASSPATSASARVGCRPTCRSAGRSAARTCTSATTTASP